VNVEFTYQASKPNTLPPANLIIFRSAIISKKIPKPNLIVVTNILESSQIVTRKGLDTLLSAGKLFYQMYRVDSSVKYGSQAFVEAMRQEIPYIPEAKAVPNKVGRGPRAFTYVTGSPHRTTGASWRYITLESVVANGFVHAIYST
jgi:hypothetical protein